MTTSRHVAVALAVAIALWINVAIAGGRTCLTVEASGTADPGLRSLVASEVARHPLHQVVTDDCQAHLLVELIEVNSTASHERFVTARLDAEVPHREPVGDDGLAAALERCLTTVLGSDPRSPANAAPGSALPQTARALEQHGRNHFTVEVLSVGAIVGSELETFPGAAIAVRREVSSVHIGSRIAAAACLAQCGRELHYSRQFAAQLDLSLYSSATRPTAAFTSLLFGIEYQRFYGRRRYDPNESYGASAAIGPALGFRGGVELLRHADTRFQFFTHAELPLFVARDRDHGVIRQWVPGLALGVGAVF